MAAKYSMSFTTGTLLLRESLTVAQLYSEQQEWAAVRDQVIANNLLQMRTANASRRIWQEVTSRLKFLTPEQLELLLNSTLQEQQYLLWLAVCLRYRFIYDFAVEIVHEKFLRLDFKLTHDDYDIYFNNKAEWHPEVENVADSTRKKQRQVVFKMMREAGFLSSQNQILPVLLTPQLIRVITHDDPSHFAIFPVSSADVKRWI